MNIKMFDSELKVMEILWREGDIPAKEIAALLAKEVGWSKTTTYTVIKKCIDKGAVSRSEEGFICHAEITKDEVREFETAELIDRMYGGSADKLAASMVGSGMLSAEGIAALKKLVEDMKC